MIFQHVVTSRALNGRFSTLIDMTIGVAQKLSEKIDFEVGKV